MPGTNLLSGWAGVVEAVALAAIAILAIAVIVRSVEMTDVIKHLATIVSVAILLILLPVIMVNIWHSMTFWQHLGIAMLGAMMGFSLRGILRPGAKNKKKR